MVKGPPVEQQQRGGRGRRRVAKWNKDVRIDDLLDDSYDEEDKYRKKLLKDHDEAEEDNTAASQNEEERSDKDNEE